MYSGGSVFDARPIALILSPLAGPDLTRSPEGCIHCCKHSTIALGGKHTAPLSLHKLPSGCMSFYRYNNHIFLISNLNHKSGKGYFCIFIGTCLRCLARLQAAMHCIGRLNRLHPRVRIPQPPLQTSRIGHRYMGAYIASMAAARQHSSPHSMPHEPVSPVKSATLPRPALDSPQTSRSHSGSGPLPSYPLHTLRESWILIGALVSLSQMACVAGRHSVLCQQLESSPRSDLRPRLSLEFLERGGQVADLQPVTASNVLELRHLHLVIIVVRGWRASTFGRFSLASSAGKKVRREPATAFHCRIPSFEI